MSYYFSNNNESRFKSISLYQDKSQVSNIDAQLKINNLESSISILKGRINYEKCQLQYLTHSEYSHKSNGEIMDLKEEIHHLKEKLSFLNAEILRLSHKTTPQVHVEDAIRKYLSKLLPNDKIYLLQRREQLQKNIQLLKQELYVDEMETRVYDKQHTELSDKLKKHQLKLTHYKEVISKYQSQVETFQNNDQQKSNQIREFMKRLSQDRSVDTRAQNVGQVLNDYDSKIASNQKLIEDLQFMMQQKELQTMYAIQNIEQEIYEGKRTKELLEQQLYDMRIVFIKQNYESTTDIENNYTISDD